MPNIDRLVNAKRIQKIENALGIIIDGLQAHSAGPAMTRKVGGKNPLTGHAANLGRPVQKITARSVDENDGRAEVFLFKMGKIVKRCGNWHETYRLL
jgi:hypothetical protein